MTEQIFQENHEYGATIPNNKKNIPLLRRHMELAIPKSHRGHVKFVKCLKTDTIGWTYKND